MNKESIAIRTIEREIDRVSEIITDKEELIHRLNIFLDREILRVLVEEKKLANLKSDLEALKSSREKLEMPKGVAIS